MEDFELAVTYPKDAQRESPGSQFLSRTILVGAFGCAPLLTNGFAAVSDRQDLRLTFFCGADPYQTDDVEFPYDELGINEVFDMPSHCPSRAAPGLERLAAMSVGNRKGVDAEFRQWIDSTQMPQSWIREGVERPTAACVDYATSVLARLKNRYALVPYKIAFSREGGVFAAYRNLHNGKTLRLEIDNELDAVGVVSDGATILEYDVFEDDDLEESIVYAFCTDAAMAPIA